MLLHSGFISTPSNLLCIHMRFNILFVVAFVCVQACVVMMGDVHMVVRYVFSCVKGVHEFIKLIAPVKGKLDSVSDLLLEEKEQKHPDSFHL